MNKYRLSIMKKLCKEGLLSIDSNDPKDSEFENFVKEFEMPKAPNKDYGAKPPLRVALDTSSLVLIFVK